MGPYPRAVERFPTLRQSRLATFDRCALSASFDEDYRGHWDGHPQARGKIMHETIARILRTMYEQNEGTVPTDVALEILEDTLRQDEVDRTCIDCGKPIVRREESRVICEDGHGHSSGFVNIPAEHRKDMRWVIVKFAHDNAFDIENLVDIEHRLESKIRYPDPGGGWVERRLTGQLDALFVAGEEDDEAIVLDWKDTWDMPRPAELGFDGYFQQRFYAFLVFRTYRQINKVTLREHYLRFSESRDAVVWRDDLEDVEREFSALAERFDRAFHEEVFPPSPGRHCQMCPRPAACPIFPGVRVEGMITDSETAERMAKELVVAVATVKDRKKALAAWTSVHGAVPISDHKGKRVWGYRATTRTTRPTREQLEEALRAGRPLQLEELFKTHTSTRFEPHSPPLEEDTTADDEEALMANLERSLEQS